MRLFHLARHPTSAIRIALVAVLLAVGMNAVAHASHRHAAEFGSTTMSPHVNACGYCATFGALAVGPQAAPGVFWAHEFAGLPELVLKPIFVRRTRAAANPRAPPRH